MLITRHVQHLPSSHALLPVVGHMSTDVLCYLIIRMSDTDPSSKLKGRSRFLHVFKNTFQLYYFLGINNIRTRNQQIVEHDY